MVGLLSAHDHTLLRGAFLAADQEAEELGEHATHRG